MLMFTLLLNALGNVRMKNNDIGSRFGAWQKEV